jgi:hypothetical protein
MKKSSVKSIISILLTLLVLGSLFSFMNKSVYNIDVNYTSTYAVGEIVKIDIETKKGNQTVQPETLNISIYNKYNKNEKIETQLTPYAEGKYSLILTPQYSGEYIVNINMTIDGEITTFEDTYTIN